MWQPSRRKRVLRADKRVKGTPHSHCWKSHAVPAQPEVQVEWIREGCPGWMNAQSMRLRWNRFFIVLLGLAFIPWFQMRRELRKDCNLTLTGFKEQSPCTKNSFPHSRSRGYFLCQTCFSLQLSTSNGGRDIITRGFCSHASWYRFLCFYSHITILYFSAFVWIIFSLSSDNLSC